MPRKKKRKTYAAIWFSEESRTKSIRRESPFTYQKIGGDPATCLGKRSAVHMPVLNLKSSGDKLGFCQQTTVGKGKGP